MTYVVCKYVLVYEAASKCALATADTYVNSQNLSSYTKVSIIRYIYIFFLRLFSCIQRGSKCERSTGHQHM